MLDTDSIVIVTLSVIEVTRLRYRMLYFCKVQQWHSWQVCQTICILLSCKFTMLHFCNILSTSVNNLKGILFIGKQSQTIWALF